jgi:tRNA threonylcarbamoyl adenosine modification protein (Sua5/YciO/YrdC/YwlC family)
MERTRGVAEAISAIRRGELVVMPTDTVYGIAADAFNPSGVTSLLDAKGRGRDMPAPVLVGSVRAAQALLEDLGSFGQDLIDEFWPGALTLVCRANPNLTWDLGEAKGTVAVRMPMHAVALEVLKESGPLAVSSANLTGVPAARTAEEAEKMLGEVVSVYLDGGPSGEVEPSSIVDLTGPVPRLLRAGAISEEKIRNICGVLLTVEDDEDDEEAATNEAATDEAAEEGEAEAEGKVDLSKSEGAPVDLGQPEGAAVVETEDSTVDPGSPGDSAVDLGKPAAAPQAPDETVDDAVAPDHDATETTGKAQGKDSE